MLRDSRTYRRVMAAICWPLLVITGVYAIRDFVAIWLR